MILRLQDKTLPALRRKIALGIFLALGTLMTAAGVYLGLKVVPEYPELASAGYVAATVCVLGGIMLIAGLLSRHRGTAAPVALTGLVAGVYLAAVLVVAPAVDPHKSARVFSGQVNELMSGGGELYSYRFWDWRSGYTFYTGRRIINLKSGDELAQLWREDRELFLIVENRRIEEAREILNGAEPVLIREIGSRTAYLFSNKNEPGEP